MDDTLLAELEHGSRRASQSSASLSSTSLPQPQHPPHPLQVELEDGQQDEGPHQAPLQEGVAGAGSRPGWLSRFSVFGTRVHRNQYARVNTGALVVGGDDDGPADGGQVMTEVDTFLRPSAGTWAAEANLDAFLRHMYLYFQSRGFWAIVASRLTNLTILGFTAAFSTFLFAFVDWAALLQCSAAQTEACKDLPSYITGQALVAPNAFHICVFIYFAVLCVYWLFSLGWAVPAIVQSWRMRNFYLQQLRISDRELVTADWSQIVKAYATVHRTGEYRVQLSAGVSAFHIASRIMRTDNYLVAIVNKEVLDLRLLGFRMPFTKSLEWNLFQTVLNHLFSKKFLLNPSLIHNPQALKRRFIVYGLINLALMPCTLVFMIVHFALKHLEEFHKKGDYLGPRQWSTYANWAFREFNELPHVFEQRMNASIKHAKEYERHFPSPVLTIVATCVSFLAGSIAAVMLALAIIDEELLLHIHWLDRNLLWYIAILSAVTAASRAFVPTPEQCVLNPGLCMRRIIAYTHYMPRHWRGRCQTYDVRDEFLQLYQFKVVSFVLELLGFITTPLLLLFCLPPQADKLIRFIQSVSTVEEDLGAVCAYAMFDVARDPKDSPAMRPKQGKVEKSLLSFQLSNPDWQDSRGQSMLHRLVEFQALHASGVVPPVPVGVPGWGIASFRDGGGGVNPPAASTTSVGSGQACVTGSCVDMADVPPLSAQSLSVPLSAIPRDHYANYFYWMDRMNEETADVGVETEQKAVYTPMTSPQARV